jgi:hypothetical protein
VALAIRGAADAPRRVLPELVALERLLDDAPADVEVRTACEVACEGTRLPVYSIALGNPDPEIPCVGFFGGIHGLERIGTQVLLHFLDDVLKRLAADAALRRRLETLRLVFMPLINPGGMLCATRSNPAGVDLMRNAPVDAARDATFMVGGQRFSARLPWFRGGASMEAESRAVCDVVHRELLGRRFALALDCHSGFGLRDRIWFPYAHTPAPIRDLAEIHALARMTDQLCPRHGYLFEPQSATYRTHGDLWDHLYQMALASSGGAFLPLTLEMGSWRWILERPRQMFSRLGLFNPLHGERRERVLGQHLPWLEFLTHMGGTWADWIPVGAERERHERAAHLRWYGATR